MIMKSCSFILLTAIILISVFTGGSNLESKDWAYHFVVWKGYLYAVTDEYVTDIGDELGQVTRYSDNEGTYSGTFSNAYKKGENFF